MKRKIACFEFLNDYNLYDDTQENIEKMINHRDAYSPRCAFVYLPDVVSGIYREHIFETEEECLKYESDIKIADNV